MNCDEMQLAEGRVVKPNWSYTNPTRVFFGEGGLAQLEAAVAEGPGRLAVVTGRNAAKVHGLTCRLLDLLKEFRIVVIDQVEQQPSYATVLHGKTLLEIHKVDTVIALGGGSVIDAAKIMACLAGSGEDLSAIMRRETALPPRKLRLIAVPTTAGSGSEVTPFAVLTENDEGWRRSVPSPYLYPDMAFIVPSTLASVPQSTAGATGMDALAHAFEALWSIHHNPVSDALAFQAIVLIANHLVAYYHDRENSSAAAGMALAATLAGQAFSNTFTAACHGLSYPIGQRFRVAHGAACAMTLPLVARVNATSVATKFGALSRHLGLPIEKDIPTFITELREQIPAIKSFRELAAKQHDVEMIAKGVYQPHMNNNPVRLGEDEIIAMLAAEL